MNRFLILALFVLLPLGLRAQESAAISLDSANRAYTDGHYDDAAKLFQQIIAAHGYSAPLCFNLGNAEAKAGHPGQAMLNYERARYLAPADTDIDHNLQIARQQAGLDPNSYRWWEMALRSIYPIAGWLVIACLALLFGALVGHTVTSSGKQQSPVLRTIFRAIFFIGIPVGLFLGFVELSAVGFTNRVEGVIVAGKEATLRLSPFDTAENIGTIPEGEMVTVEQRHNDFFRVEGRDHHFGWVQGKDIEPIIAGSFDANAAN
jgi:hypothetical protein